MTDPYQTPARRDADQFVLPVCGALFVLGVLMMLCSPLTALNLASPPMPLEVAEMAPDDRPPPPPVRPIDAAAVFVFFLLGTVGTVGGLLGIARITYGRWLLVAFCVGLLAYLALAVGYRLTGGLQAVVDTSPTRSATGMFFVCTVVPIALTVLLLIASLRYLLRRDVARSFRGVTLGEPKTR